MHTLKVFFAGKANPNSKFAYPFWRDHMCWMLNSSLINYKIIDTSLIIERNKYLTENELPPNLSFSQSCLYIKRSDVMVVNLTDDISVGGSQEVFIARQMGIPVIGFLPKGNKFNRLKYVLGEQTYWNYEHPFVSELCDVLVNDVEELVVVIDNYCSLQKRGLESFNQAIHYYQRTAGAFDRSINGVLSFGSLLRTPKNRLRIYFAGKMEDADGFHEKDWRQYFTDLITEKSLFEAINLDFIGPSHEYIRQNDAELIFGRDLYLIRAADAIVVNLSDNISLGGSVEMMLAKLFHRPLIGLTKREGKFVSTSKDILGRKVSNYINPFVAATCDQLIFDIEDLPAAINKLHKLPVKTNSIITDSAKWYEATHLRRDTAAKLAFNLS